MLANGLVLQNAQQLIKLFKYAIHILSELWEKLLEVCIYLQKMLTISNRLPSHEVCPEFVEHGKQPATDSVAYGMCMYVIFVTWA